MIYPMDRKLAPDDGLNVVEYNNAPEVVHLGHDMPEVAPRGKFASPFHEKVVVQYDVAPALAHSEYGDPSRNYMINQPIQTGGRQRRICGIKRPIFLLLAVILILLITAAVLGGVLSAVLGKKNVSAQAQVSNSTSSTLPSNASNTTTSNPATEAMDMTGLALLSPPGSSTMYAYYANKLGVIVEATLPQSPGSSSKPFDLSNSAIANVSTNALPGSSIAAVSYVQNGNTIRQIFYFGSAGLLTMASGSDGKWSSSWSTVASTTQPYRSNAALSAVADTHALQGIRVYFASQRGVIQECGVYFVENIWRDGQYFVGSDPTAGVASAITNNINHVYMRNISSVLQQWTFNYTADVAQPGQPWKIGADLKGVSIASNSTIAMASDGQDTDYIWYQASNGQTTLATVSGSSLNLNSGSAMTAAFQGPPGYALAAAWSGAMSTPQAVAIRQNNSAPANLLLTGVNSAGSSTSTSTFTTSE